MVAAGAQFVAVGEGEPALESAFREIGRRYEGSIGIRIGYEEGAAHRLQAGCDILLAPARFEPCGLTQIYASRYGTVPIVRRTGGLADTVVDATGVALVDRTATGFRFEEPSLSALLGAIARALALYKEPLAWRRLQLQGMAQDFGWHESAAKYIALYHDTTGIPAGDRPGVSLTDAELRKQAAR
ncbi:MAG: glycosyltransferase [Rhizomicrobium sp.]